MTLCEHFNKRRRQPNCCRRPERDQQTLDLALRQTFVLSMLGRQREIWEILQTHADQVERVVDPLLTSEYHFRVGLTCFYLGKFAQGQVAGETALSEGERAGNPEAIGKALHVLSLIAFESGRPRGWYRPCEKSHFTA